MSTWVEKIAGPKKGPSDRYLLGAVSMLVAIGIVAVYSAISYMAGLDTHLWLGRHMLYAGIGLVVMIVISRIDYHILAEKGIGF